MWIFVWVMQFLDVQEDVTEDCEMHRKMSHRIERSNYLTTLVTDPKMENVTEMAKILWLNCVEEINMKEQLCNQCESDTCVYEDFSFRIPLEFAPKPWNTLYISLD
jgi:hypothetical protein